MSDDGPGLVVDGAVAASQPVLAVAIGAFDKGLPGGLIAALTGVDGVTLPLVGVAAVGAACVRVAADQCAQCRQGDEQSYVMEQPLHIEFGADSAMRS